MSAKQTGSESIIKAFVAGVPIFCCLRSLEQAVAWTVLIVLTTVIGGASAAYLKRFFLPKFHLFVLLLMLSSVLEGVFLFGTTLWPTGLRGGESLLPFAFASVFLLTPSVSGGAFLERFRSFIYLFGFLILMGAFYEAVAYFPPAPFLIAGVSMGIVLIRKEKVLDE